MAKGMALTRNFKSRSFSVFHRLHCHAFISDFSIRFCCDGYSNPVDKTGNCLLKIESITTKQRYLKSESNGHIETAEDKNNKFHSTMKSPYLSLRFGKKPCCDNVFGHATRTFQRTYHSGQCCRGAVLEMPMHTCIYKRRCSSDSGNNSDSEEVKLYLDAVAPPIKRPSVHVDIVPGKKGPPPEPPIDCCMSGCANCVWIQYAEELKNYFTEGEGLVKAKEAIETIENPGLKMFLKLELGLL